MHSLLRVSAVGMAIALGASACSGAASSPPAPISSPSAPGSAALASAAPATPQPSASASAIASPTASYGPYDWSYEGATGPEHWAELDPSYYACKHGVIQSPIELAGADEKREKDPVFDYHEGTARIVNDGHTVMAIPNGMNTLEIYHVSYFDDDIPEATLVQDSPVSYLQELRFHVPPEHVIYGAQPAAAEVQFVHQDANGAYTIVGAMVVEGAEENEAWAPYVDAMGAPITFEGVPVTIDWANLIRIEPEMDSYRYDGSLTTPPCTERVEWIFFLEPIRLSAAQIAKMRAAYDGNARPLQPVVYYRDITRDDKGD